ncbi:MAG: gliding motility lipoprotein GldH [Muribaculaceae bacterium]|nr:gliding motility lipoprotein GldH [Muribaculaceae bacterium]
MTAKQLIAAALVTMSAILCSCGFQGGYSEYTQLPKCGWAYGDTVAFSTDTLAAGPMAIALRYNASYPFRNLVIEASDSSRRDTVTLYLCDEFGRRLGTGVGNSYQSSAPLPFTPRPGSVVNLRHVLRVDTLRGIEQIGLIPAGN